MLGREMERECEREKERGSTVILTIRNHRCQLHGLHLLLLIDECVYGALEWRLRDGSMRVIGSWLAVCVYGIWWVDRRMCVVDAISLLPGSGTPWPPGMRALPLGVFALCFSLRSMAFIGSGGEIDSDAAFFCGADDGIDSNAALFSGEFAARDDVYPTSLRLTFRERRL
jgi:hypothetical protein